MKWLRDRLSESGTWAGVSAGITFYYLWSILPDTLHSHMLMTAAMSAALAAFFLKEAGR